MADLLQTARLFEVGTRLQTASSNLIGISKGDAPDADALRWAGGFLSQVDRTSGLGSQPGIDGGLTAAATNTRPKFFAALLRIQDKFQEIGITSDDKVDSFLKATYKCLKSGGAERDDLKAEHLRLAGELLQVLSRSIMVELSNNGLPKREPMLSVGESTLTLHKIRRSDVGWDLIEDVQQACFDPGVGADRECQETLWPTETAGAV